jgi:hypothetical protein
LAGADGTVPCEALTTGPEGESTGWRKRFEDAVRKDARDRGLSRGRWSGWMTAVLTVTALAPALLGAAAITVAPTDKSSSRSNDDNPVAAFVGIAAIIEFGLLAIPGKMRAERDTAKGRDAAARWLGLREYLGDDGAFADAPPAAVAVWDRYLAYGAALGVAAGAVRALPLGAESDKEAWSSYGGRWRKVEIDYPKRIPPGWGRHPALATLIALASLAIGLFVARIFFPALADVASRLTDSTDQKGGFQPLDLLAAALIAVPALVTGVWSLRALFMLVAALPDLTVRTPVEGVVLRLRTHEDHHYLAVDDGTGDHVRAWLVDATVLSNAGLTQGAHVRATVSPRLGHVFELHRISAGETAP